MNAVSSSPLLDVAESALKARPLRSWKPVHKDAVRDRFAALHRDWSAEWIPVHDKGTVALDVEVVEPDGTMTLPSDEGACWAFADSSRRTGAPNLDPLLRAGRDGAHAPLQAIANRMFSFDMASAITAPASPSIAPVVVRAAWADWLQRIGAQLSGFELESQRPRGTPGTIAPSSPWSGALHVRWAWCGGVWSLGLSHDVVAALLGQEAVAKRSSPPAPASQAPKERLDQALAGQHLALRVMLNGAELNLGQLQELRIDDVVPLEHLLDSPALVVSTDGTPVCDGWLGQSEGRIAVELTAPARAPAPSARAAVPTSNTPTSKEKKP